VTKGIDQGAMPKAPNDSTPPERRAQGLAKLSPERRKEIARLGAITRRNRRQHVPRSDKDELMRHVYRAMGMEPIYHTSRRT
jgi:hypothetical protein